MKIYTVTPERNVLISKNCLKSENPDLFYCKIINDNTLVEIYDVTERKKKSVLSNELNIKNHRIIINGKKFYICAVRECS